MEQEHLDIIQKLGFSPDSMLGVKGRLSIADLFPKSKQRCGIYCFKKENATYYIGQSIDIVKRFAQHCKNHDNIAILWFFPIPKKKLDDTEKTLIQEAEQKLLPLVNKSLMSNIIGETDFDYLISPEDQTRWLNEKQSINTTRILQIEEKYRIRYRDNYQRFSSLPAYNDLKRILKKFIFDCIPFPRTTEMSFWELTCLPNTNKSHHPRYFSLNINFMEVLVAGYSDRNKRFWSFINTSKEKLLKNQDCSKIHLSREYKSLTFDNTRSYKAGGYDQIQCHLEDIGELASFLSGEQLVAASKHFNLRLMRKGATIYSHYHCFDLVDNLLKNN